MNCALEPFGGGSRVVSLWDMLRFHADKFVEVLNLLKSVEDLMARPQAVISDPSLLQYWDKEVQRLKEQLEELGLRVSAKMAHRVHIGLTHVDRESPDGWAMTIRKYCGELRERVADELEGKAIYYVSDRVDLLSESPLFGNEVDGAFPSAQYDIAEAGRCLALSRSTASVGHLMRALEVALASLANALGLSLTTDNWNTILNDIENEIRSRNKATHGPAWKVRDEPFFAGAATHFRLVKNAWRNHAAHGRVKYTEQEAEDIYGSVRSFMRHLSERLSEEELSS